jgi:hypothetical protein
MGPWQLREGVHPFRPGCSYETLRELVKRGRITRNTVLRGPTTRQFWSFAGRTPSVANLLGVCHNCQAEVDPGAFSCQACGAAFSPDTDRQHLGLAPVHLLPGQASPEIIAATAATQTRVAPRGEPRPRIAPAEVVPEVKRERRRMSAGWVAGGLVVVAALAGGAWLVMWALKSPVPAVLPAPAPSPLAAAPEPALVEPSARAPQEQPVAPKVEASIPEPEPPPAAPAPAEPPAPVEASPDLAAEFAATNLDLEAFAKHVDDLHERGVIDDALHVEWRDRIKARRERERLRRVP